MLRPATDDDWSVFTGKPVPETWVGFVAENEWMILGLGGLYVGTDGRWWATFRRAPGVKLDKTAHLAALKTIKIARDMGIAPRALADDRISASQRWLRHLGFEPTDEQIKDMPVWVLK